LILEHRFVLHYVKIVTHVPTRSIRRNGYIAAAVEAEIYFNTHYISGVFLAKDQAT